MTTTPSGETILVIEDDALIRGVIRFILTRAGYEALEAEDGNKALAVARRYIGPIHLLVADVHLPGPHGPDVWRRLRADRPGLPALFISGYATAVAGDGLPAAGELNFLRKPFKPAALLVKAREVIDRAAVAGTK